MFDPDPVTRSAIDTLVDQGRDARDQLVSLFDGRIAFGTAGLRAAVGPGPNRMNALVVRQTTSAVAGWLRDGDHADMPTPRVLVGFDARTDSATFARHVAATLLASGVEPLLADGWAPTPVFAHALLAEAADAAIVITASHNPAPDNGYKLYACDGLQIVAPAETEIASLIDDRTARWHEYGTTIDDVFADDALIDQHTCCVDDWVVRHCGDVVSMAPAPAGALRVVYTALHGVGTAPMVAAMTAAGFAPPVLVDAQAAPDPAFPTVMFPNPEEPGALDLAMAMGAEVSADVVVAHDPDADRLAIAVADRSGERWQRLSGDELGALLGDYVLAKHGEPGAVVARSVVSGRLLDAIAEAAGASCHVTLTGFKWIARTALDSDRWLFGYEEAIGYAVGSHVRDKDGIGAGLVALAMLSELHATGRTVWDRLDELYLAHGVHLTSPVTVRFEDSTALSRVVTRLDALTPEALGGSPITAAGPIGGGSLPPTPGVEWQSADGSRVLIRPSGTEPKIKAYLEVVEPPAASLDDVAASLAAAKVRLAVLVDEVHELLSS